MHEGGVNKCVHTHGGKAFRAAALGGSFVDEEVSDIVDNDFVDGDHSGICNQDMDLHRHHVVGMNVKRTIQKCYQFSLSEPSPSCSRNECKRTILKRYQFSLSES